MSVLIGIVDQYEADQPTFGWFDQPINNIFYGGNGFSEGDAFANSEFIALVVFAAVLFYFAWRRRRRDQRLLLFVGLLTATAGLVQLEPRIWGGMPWPILDYGQAAPVSFATFISLMTPQLITCFLLFSAVIGYFLHLWPVDIRNESRLENGPPRIRHALRWHFVALVLAVAVIGMVVYSSRQNWDTGSVLGNDAQKGPVNWLMGDLLGDFHGLIQDLPIFMFWPVVASLFGGLWFRSRLDNGVFFVDRRLTIKLLGLLYAGLFVGIWGEDFIFDVPIAFVAAYILFPRVTVSSRLENFEREMRFQGMPEPSFGQRLSFSQPALLRAEEKRKRLKAQLAVMDRGDHMSVEQEDYERRRQEIETEIESTAKRWNSNNQHPSPEPRRRRLFGKLRKNSINDSNIVILAPGSIDPESIDPGQIALAVGRESTWWDNGWLCVRTGALLAAAPSAYYLYQAWNSGQLWPLNVGVGLITSLQNAASIPLGWLTLCFVYGCMLPYLKGSSAPVRGAILGLVALISFALDAVPTYTLRGPHYSTFLIDGIIAVVFTAALAVIMDARVLRRRGVNINYLIDIYRLSTLRVSLTYASTILIIIIGVWQQAHVNNQVSQERAQISTSVVNTLRNQLTQPTGR